MGKKNKNELKGFHLACDDDLDKIQTKESLVVKKIPFKRLSAPQTKYRNISFKRVNDKKHKDDIHSTPYISDWNDRVLTFDDNYKNINKKNDISKKLLNGKKVKRINPALLSNYVIDMYNIIFINSLYYYDIDRGYFKSINKQQAKTLIASCIPNKITKYSRSYDIEDAYRLMQINGKIQFAVEQMPKNQEIINCLNGVIDLNSGKLLSHEKSYYFLNCINASYRDNYKIRKTKFIEFINEVTNDDYELICLIQEMMGYCISNYNNAKVAFMVYGNSNSGKSVFLRLISHLCGEENVSNVEMQNLSEKKYTAQLFGKLLNICNELPDESIEDTGMFKALVSENDKVIAREVFGQPFSFYNKAKLIFATNNLPAINTNNNKDNTAFFNRLKIIPFMNSIPENKQDRELFEKLIKEKDIIFSWAIDGLIRYVNNGYKFSQCNVSNNLIKDYIYSQNIEQAFIEEMCEFDKDCRQYKYEIDNAFKEYCLEQGLGQPSNRRLILIKNILINKYGLEYKKFRQNEENRYGFIGIRINK